MTRSRPKLFWVLSSIIVILLRNSSAQGPYECPPGDFHCFDGKCLPGYLQCNNHNDCSHGEDELNCRCQPNEFRCNDGACILGSLQCDGRPDCPDGSDEDCPPYQDYGHCRTNEWTCNNGQCVSSYSRCDKRPDCADGSDEWDCPPTQPADPQLNLKTYPPSQVIRESREVVFRCRDEGPTRARVKWARSGGLPLPTGSKDTDGRLEIPNIRESDSGEYVCEAIGFPPQTSGQSVRVVLTVERFNPYSNKTQGCGPMEATCMNGGCIPKSQICDNHTDCTDGSDEYACSMGRGCHPDEFMCKNSRCVTKLWVCDGDDDCGDQSDEESCDLTPSGSPCRSFEFQCGNGQCIPRSFHCDGSNECQDGSDEFGCIEPHLVTPPEPVVVLQTGATLNLTCRAVGIPTPLILWRRNWGFVPDKCVSTSVDGFGILTCPNMYHEDSGAYSCEMLNVKDRVFATPDANVLVEPDRGVCPNGFFNVLARQRDDCISCFCFGVSNECRSADLYVLELQPPITSHHVIGVYFPSDPYGDLEFTDYSAQSQLPILQGPEFRTSGIPFTRDVPYLSLPAGYHGNQLKSYGGFFKYEVVFSGDGPLTSTPYAILSGNGYKLVHNANLNLRPHVRNQIKIRFVPDQWIHSNGSRASREELMMVLANVENILVKLRYVDNVQRELEIMHITMDSASWDDRGLGSAPLVEHCTCPPGYVGHSCETCAPGYVRVSTGSWLGRCVMTEECESGQFGDPSRGIPCRRCPCPLTNPENNFARSCSLGADGNAICHCYRGYTGVRCEQCEVGFEGNPLQPGGRCVETQLGVCDRYGTEYLAQNGSCVCKSNAQGYYCEQCKPNSFNLNEHSLTGCTACFCMGVTKTCTSSSWYRDTIHARFGGVGYDHGFSLVADINPDETEPIGDYHIEPVDNELRFTGRNDDRILYWSLPAQFLGDKVFSYGGYLNYTIRYNPQPGGSMSKNNAPDVIIKSNRHVKFFHHRKTDVLPGIPQTYSVPIVETVFERTDGILVDREHVLMSLSDVSAIYIKATYTTVTDEAAISHVSLDIATPQNTGRRRAVEVEQCSCPVGHFGLSCQSCTPGYTKGTGFYLGECEPCDCNGHSEECDSETGECYNCRDNTAGEHCDECAPGFIGNATSGRPYDCVPSGSGDACQGCDPRGTLRCEQGTCVCKQNVEGFYCNQCRRGSYNLQESNVDGCSECYCSGVSKTCRSSTFTRMPIPSMLSYMDITIADYDGKVAPIQNVQAEMERNDIVSDFDSLGGTYFWSLPSEGFLGNQLNAYGGLLEFDIVADGYGSYVPSEDVILRGKGMTLIWSRPPGTENRRHVSVRLHESDRWNLYDVRGLRPASHEVFLQVLSDVNQLLIRATLKSPTRDSRLGNITIHKAVPSPDGEPAYEVEVCQCPLGYSGDICESCSPFYYRDMQNECVRCPCNTDGTEECVSQSNGFYECRCRQFYEGPLCQYPIDYQPYPPVPTPPPSPTHSNVSIEIKITSMPQRFVQVGESVILDCSGHIIFTSTPIPVTWHKVDNELPLHATEDQGRLYLHNLQPSDSGIYVCRGRYKDEVVTANVTIIVGSQPTKPRVTLIPPYMTVEENESVSVHCEAIGEPTPQVTWQRGDGHTSLPSSAYVDNDYLHFRNIRKQDEGFYHCLAENSEGYVDGNVQIYVNSLAPIPSPPGPSSIYIDPPTGIQTRPGDEFELVCYGPGGGNWYYTWTKDNIPLQSGGNVRIDQGVIKITQCRSYDSGVYTCEAEDPRTGRREFTSVTVHIDEPSYEPIVIKEMPRDNTVVQGKNYTLVCEASGSPPPTVKWTMHHSSPDSNVFMNNNVLTIVNARISNRGYYVCIAESGSQSKQAFVMIDVEPREVPLLEIVPQNPFIAHVGEQATFHCRDVQGIPKPIIRWTRRDGRPLPSNSYEAEGTLSFENLNIENAGEYECTANNVAGFATEYMQLIVHEPPLVTTHPEDSLTLYEGEALLLECYATGYPAPTVTWNDNHLGSSYQPGVFDQSQRQRASLRINSVTLADTRQYICTAVNDVGTDAKTVSVMVRPRGGSPPHPQPPVRPPTYPPYSVGVGDRAELSCEVENLNGNTRWHRVDGRPLPSGSKFAGSHLIIESVQLSDAGQYECIVYDDYNQRHISVTAEIIVLPSPRITFSPPMPMHVSSGEDVIVYCNVTGDRPIHIKWHAENHRPLPPTVIADGATLRFPRITPSDAGRYYCAAENIHGNTTKVAEVLVKHNRPEHTYTVGDTVELACDESYGREPGMQYHWLRQGADIPLNAERRDSRLILRNIQQQDAGRYTCEIISLNQVRASNTADVYVKPAAVPSYSKPQILSKSYGPFRTGEIVELECMSELDYAQTVWERERYQLPTNARQYGNKLVITDLKREDAGEYICLVYANDGNSFSSSYDLKVENEFKEPVQDREQKIIQTDVQSTVTLQCDPKYYGGTYKWTRQNGQFAPNVDTTQSQLVLRNVQARDAGTYVCTNQHKGQTYETEMILLIIGAMPYFPQAPNSYIIYPPPENEFSKLRFSISFKPESPNGLILYNGHKYGNYIALSLDDGYPEFRYNFHDEDVVIRAEKPIELGRWHTVKINRARVDGFMTVDDQPPVAFPTASEFHEFNVADKLYVGSVPTWDDIPPAAVSSFTGFVGCVSRLVLSNRIVELNEDALHKENTTSCEPCANDPCQNEGICLESQAELGYSCICPEGFTGRNCGVMGSSCTLDMCGVGRCENTDSGFECYCPLHTGGDRCEYPELIDGDSLSFKSNGYAAYKTPKATKLSISFSIRPSSLDDSLIMYTAESATSVGDYIAVVLRNHHIELIVSIGARLDPLVIRSKYPVELEKWTDIHISRKTGVTYLTVGNEDQQHIRSKGNTRNMFLTTNLYLGGYDNRIELGKSINVSQGFDGCIAKLNSSNEPIHMLRDLKEAANVQSCRNDNEIDPYQNGNNYDDEDWCDETSCMNGGTCIATEHGSTYCQCPIGLAGEHCEQEVEVESSIFFRGDGYLELNRSTISSGVDEYTTYLGVQFSTLAPDGLIFWYGQRKDEPFYGNDFMALSLVDGYAEFAFRLDNEEGRVRHGQARLNDGLTHLVKLERNGNEGSIEIMNNVNNFQTIPKQRKEMHLPGHIFIGGAPDLEKFTGKRFIHGFRGCISGFENLHSGPVNFVRNAVSYSKVDKCPSGELLDPDDFASDLGTEPPAL